MARTDPRGIKVPYLRAWRDRRVMTAADLSRASGVGVLTISHAEHGSRLMPRTIRLLAQALNISAEQLVHSAPPSD